MDGASNENENEEEEEEEERNVKERKEAKGEQRQKKEKEGQRGGKDRAEHRLHSTHSLTLTDTPPMRQSFALHREEDAFLLLSHSLTHSLTHSTIQYMHTPSPMSVIPRTDRGQTSKETRNIEPRLPVNVCT